MAKDLILLSIIVVIAVLQYYADTYSECCHTSKMEIFVKL